MARSGERVANSEERRAKKGMGERRIAKNPGGNAGLSGRWRIGYVDANAIFPGRRDSLGGP